MRVIVPQPDGYPPVAARCLTAEGLDHEVVRLDDRPTAYGELMKSLWLEREGFVIVEHDIAPWPGAVTQLMGCSEILCGYDYMRGGNIGHSLGCTRFSKELIEMAPDAWKGWGDNAPLLQWDLVDWLNVDAAVFDVLAGYGVALNQSVDFHPHTFHTHVPPVAHARRENEG